MINILTKKIDFEFCKFLWTENNLWRCRNDRRSEHNLCNCIKKPEKEKNSGLQLGFNPWPRDLPVPCSTNWAMKPLTLGAGQLWVHMFPWKKWVLIIYEINPPFPFPPETPDTQSITTTKHKLTALLTLLERYMASLFFSLSLTLFCQLQHFGGLVWS